MKLMGEDPFPKQDLMGGQGGEDLAPVPTAGQIPVAGKLATGIPKVPSSKFVAGGRKGVIRSPMGSGPFSKKDVARGYRVCEREL